MLINYEISSSVLYSKFNLYNFTLNMFHSDKPSLKLTLTQIQTAIQTHLTTEHVASKNIITLDVTNR